MSLEENKALIRKEIEAINKKDLTIIDKTMAPDYVDHTNQLQGREGIKQFYTKVFKDFPDFHRTIEDIIAEGNKVWVLFKITGTSPSGKKMELTTVTIFRIVDGKVVEGWGVPKVTGELYQKLL